MPPSDRISTMVMSSVVAWALKDNPLYNTFIVLQGDMKDVDFDKLDYYSEHIMHMENTHKIAPKILMASDIRCTG